MARKRKVNQGAAQQLRWQEWLLVRLLALFMAAWSRSCGFRCDAETQAFIGGEIPAFGGDPLAQPTLCVAPSFFRRNFKHRKIGSAH